MNEIVVTAQRRSESIQDVPISHPEHAFFADLGLPVIATDVGCCRDLVFGHAQKNETLARRADELPILPGVMPIIGETDEQAKELQTLYFLY